MRRLFASLLGCILVAGCAGAPPSGQNLGPDAVPVGGALFALPVDGSRYVLFLDGEITSETSYVFQSMVEVDDINGLIVAASPGGDLLAAHQIGKAIRREGINTAVMGVCVSACVDVFVAGRSREMHPTAKLMMHPANDRTRGYALDRPYWAALGLTEVNERVYAMADGELWVVDAERAVAMRMATGLLGQ